jgi:hypothetical protein
MGADAQVGDLLTRESPWKVSWAFSPSWELWLLLGDARQKLSLHGSFEGLKCCAEFFFCKTLLQSSETFWEIRVTLTKSWRVRVSTSSPTRLTASCSVICISPFHAIHEISCFKRLLLMETAVTLCCMKRIFRKWWLQHKRIHSYITYVTPVFL